MKNNKGITIVALIATITILLILLGVMITSTYTGSDYKKYKLMCADVELLENKILVYYNQYGELPKKEEVTELPDDIYNGHTFFEIDLGKLKNITLNHPYKYIVDTETFEVYSLTGIQYKDEFYYTN